MHMQGCTKWIIPSREEQGFLNGESARQQSFLRPFPIKWFAFLTVHGGERVDGDTDAHRTLLDLAGSSLRAGRQTQAKAFTLFHVCCNVLASFSPYVFTHHFNWSSLSIYLLCDYWRIWVFIYQFTTCFPLDLPVLCSFFSFLTSFGLSKMWFHFPCFIDLLILLLVVFIPEITGHMHPWLTAG